MFLSTLASILRLNLFSTQTHLTSWLGVEYEILTTTEYQRQAGYLSGHVLINIFAYLPLIVVLQLALIVAHLTEKPATSRLKLEPNGRTEKRYLPTVHKVSNTLIRLCLLIFLEVFICALINVRADSSLNGNMFATISRVIAIGLLVLLSAAIVLWLVITIEFLCAK